MKLLFVLLMLVSCNKKEQPETADSPVSKTETQQEKKEFQVGNCYRYTGNKYYDFFARVDKKYDHSTVNWTVIKNLEYYTEIQTMNPNDFMDYSCEAFNDMMKTSTPYKPAVEECEECNCDKEN